ncbi:uncharacterized protein LOC116337306 [Contarinia nasturtii]|uniref:uncharacterized protein LOC116337306 n=1 Tax=Contarinia nasturtii TaxID=265458 RepID=UPI0012D4A934|nr:uncharacterized protein LOC116337306 [Contarinia nasturtii]
MEVVVILYWILWGVIPALGQQLTDCVYINHRQDSVQLICDNFNTGFDTRDDCFSKKFPMGWVRLLEGDSIKVGGYGCGSDVLKFVSNSWREFDISTIGISELPTVCIDDVAGPKLQKMNASHNKIADNSKLSFAMCPNLKELDLSYNKISTFNAKFPSDTQLEALHLENNQIKKIEFNVPFTQLRYLNVSNNQLQEVFDQHFVFTSLETLILDVQKVTEFLSTNAKYVVKELGNAFGSLATGIRNRMTDVQEKMSVMYKNFVGHFIRAASYEPLDGEKLVKN